MFYARDKIFYGGNMIKCGDVYSSNETMHEPMTLQ